MFFQNVTYLPLRSHIISMGLCTDLPLADPYTTSRTLTSARIVANVTKIALLQLQQMLLANQKLSASKASKG